MAVATLQPMPVPDPIKKASLDSAPSKSRVDPNILEEVRISTETLRSRLAGALTSAPDGVDSSRLPTVPLIDLGPSYDGTLESRQAVAAHIREACTTSGFFQISNHGITQTATAGILAQAKCYFHELSQAQKDAMHIKHSDYFRGYEPSDASFTGDLNAETTINSQTETKQGFNWGYEPSLDPTGGDGQYVELDGSVPPPGHGYNVWPAEDELPGFHAGVAEYYGQVMALAVHLFRLFALSLDLDEGYFDSLTTHPGGIGRLIYYPPQPARSDDEKDNAGAKLGLGAHTDYECFTLLLSSSNPGLEILFPPSPLTDNRPLWRPCPVRPDTLTVNVADFLMRWTNGLYKSTIHRVVTRPGVGERYSVPLFFSINYDADVDRLPIELGGGDGRDYKPMKAGRYVLERLRATRAIEDETG